MSSLAKSKSDFNSMSLFSGYSGKREKSEEEREMEKKLFYGRKSGVSKLARHGFYEDNSMEAKDRNDRRSKVQLERKMSSMVSKVDCKTDSFDVVIIIESIKYEFLERS